MHLNQDTLGFPSEALEERLAKGPTIQTVIYYRMPRLMVLDSPHRCWVGQEYFVTFVPQDVHPRGLVLSLKDLQDVNAPHWQRFNQPSLVLYRPS